MFRNATVRAIHFPSLVWAEQKSWNRLEESFSALCAMIEVQSYLLGANIFNPFCAYLHIDKCWPTIITTHGIHNPFIITIENDHFAIVFVEFHKNEIDKDVKFDEMYFCCLLGPEIGLALLSKYKYLPIFTIVTPASTFFSRFVWSIKWLFWTLFKLNLKPEILQKTNHPWFPCLDNPLRMIERYLGRKLTVTTDILIWIALSPDLTSVWRGKGTKTWRSTCVVR